MNYTEGSQPEQFRSGRVSSEFFSLFGAQTIQGRTFTPEEDRPGGDRVVVLSKGLWETRFTSDPAVVGKAMSLGGFPYTVVGVLGDFNFQDFGAQPPQVWVPFQLDPNTADQGHYFQSAGRLKDGVSLEQAKARLNASSADFKAKFTNGAGTEPVVRRRAGGRGAGPQRAAVAVRLDWRRRLRPADRVRQRRQPAAGARHGPQARDRDPRGARRLARPHHQPGA